MTGVTSTLDRQEIISRLIDRYQASGASISEFLETLNANLSSDDPLEHSVISRIIAGKTNRPHPATLAKIDHALGSAMPHTAIDRNREPDELRIGAVHTFFSAPAFLALANAPMRTRVAMTSFMRKSAFDRVGEPCWSEIETGKTRNLIAPNMAKMLLDNESAISHRRDLADEQYVSNGKSGWNHFISGAQIIDLWQSGLIDLAVVSSDIFDLMNRRRGSNEALALANLCYSTRGLALVTLLNPIHVADCIHNEKLLDVAPASGFASHAYGGSISNAYSQWRADFRHLWNFLLAYKSKKTGLPLPEVRQDILCPRNTFAKEHVDALVDIGRANREIWGGITASTVHSRAQVEIDIGNYSEMRDRIFRHLKEGGSSAGITIAAWEPYVTMLRHDWENFVHNEFKPSMSDSTLEEFKVAGKNEGVSPEKPKDFTFSFQRAVGRIVALNDEPFFPAVTMDLFIRRTFADKIEINASSSLSSLSGFMTNMRVSADRLNEAIKQRNAADSVMEFLVDYLFAGMDLDRSVLRRRAFRAAANCHFSVTYHADFLDYKDARECD